MTKLPPGSSAPAGATAQLRVLATTDLHMHLTAHDYLANRPDPTVGLCRVASLIRLARNEAGKNGALTMLFDNGDGLQGAAFCDPTNHQPPRDHPLIRAFNHLRYDAIGLGNHDFNYGLKALESTLTQADCAVVCSNARRLDSAGSPPFAPFAILDRMVPGGGSKWPLRIGVLSFLPPQTVLWDRHQLQGQIEVDDILASARRRIPQLRRAGCDLIIALAHSGLGSATAFPGMENAVIPLAALDGIDAIVAGHTHLLLPGPHHVGIDHVDASTGSVHGKPVVMAGSAGSHLGVIDLDLETTAQGRWRVAGFKCRLRPVSRRGADGLATALTGDDPDLSNLLARDHDKMQAAMSTPVGHADRALHSYFTFVAPDHALALVGAAQAAALRPLLEGSSAADLPLLSAASPGKFGGRAGPQYYCDVPAGPLMMRHVADLHVFPNQLAAVVVNGAQLRDWLEMSASLFHQISAGSHDKPLRDPAMPGHDFDVLHGVTYQIDLSAPARFLPDGTLRASQHRRIRNLCFEGAPVASRQRFVVALNSYRASGGGNVAAVAAARHIGLPKISIRDALLGYLSGQLPVDPLAWARAPWTFAPMPETTVTALTGPGAMAHLDELAERGIKPAGIDPQGFLRLQVTLPQIPETVANPKTDAYIAS